MPRGTSAVFSVNDSTDVDNLRSFNTFRDLFAVPVSPAFSEDRVVHRVIDNLIACGNVDVSERDQSLLDVDRPDWFIGDRLDQLNLLTKHVRDEL